MKIAKEKITIIITILIDVIGFSIIIPVLPFYISSFGASTFTMTLLFSIFSLCSFFSAPLLGSLSDKIGRRPIMIISIASSAIGWYFFAFAHSLIWLFIGRIIDGLAAGNLSTAQSYLSDLAKDKQERTQNMGLFGAAFGLGFLIGPFIGAILSSYSHSLPFLAVAILSTINLIGAIFFLPETKHKDHTNTEKISLNPFTPVFSAFRDNNLKSRYLIWFLFNLANTVQQTIFAIYLFDQFGLTAAFVGYIMTFMGLIMIINQGFLMQKFWLKYFKESKLEIVFTLIFSISYLLMAIPNIFVFLLALLPMILGQSLLRVIMSSRASGIAGIKRRGEVLGIMSSIQSTAAIIGPLISGIIYANIRYLPFLIASATMFMVFIIFKYFCPRVGEINDDDLPIAEAL